MRMRLAPLLVATVLLATGCWDRVEVNDLAIVQMTSFDKVGDQYRVAVSFPLVGQMGGSKGGGGGTGGSGDQSNYFESAESEALRTSFMHVQRKLSRSLYFAHRRVMLIGEDLARDGITRVLDIISRYPENRISTYLLIAKGEALDLMKTPVLMERIPAEMFREIIISVLNRPVTARDFIQAQLAEGVDPYALAFKRSKTDTGDGDQSANTIEISGLAVFRDDKLAGMLEGRHVNGALAALNQLRRPIFSAKLPGQDDFISAQFTELASHIHPVVENGQLRIQLQFSGIYEINVNETDLTLVNLEHDDRVTEAIERELKNQVSAAVRELQERFATDILGFGHAVRLHHPRLWKKISGRWRDLYPHVPVEYAFNIRLEHVGSLNRTINENEKEFRE